MTTRRFESATTSCAVTERIGRSGQRSTTTIIVSAHPAELPGDFLSPVKDRSDTRVRFSDPATVLRNREVTAKIDTGSTDTAAVRELLVLCSDLALDEARAAIAVWRRGDADREVVAVPLPSDGRHPASLFPELGSEVTRRMTPHELEEYIGDPGCLVVHQARESGTTNTVVSPCLAIQALDGCTDAVLAVDKSGSVMVANRAFCEMFKTGGRVIAGTPVGRFFNEPSQELLQRRLEQAMAGNEASAGYQPEAESLVGLRGNGGGILVHTDFRATVGSGNHCLTLTMRDVSNDRRNEDELRLLAARLEMRSEDLERAIRTHTVELHAKNAQLKQEIEERKRAQQELAFRANYDPLTRLPNRSLFIDRLSHRIDRLDRSPGELFAVLFLDLDGFKLVNDSMGHHIGDQLLVEVAGRLRRCVRPLDTIARMGGDEFTILLDQVSNPADVIRVAQRVQAELSSPLELASQKIFLTVSVGIALNNVVRRTPQDYLRDADAAMYRAKEKGKARYEIFDHGMHGKAVNRLKLESDLRDAVQMQQFVLHYQPIVSLHTGHLAGFEALVRWQSPERGMVPPLEFIPVLEETGLIVEMGEWAIFESLGQLKHWTDAGLASKGVTMAVNVSRRQLLSAHLSQTIAHALQTCEMPGERLEVEITESSVMVNREVAVHVLDQLRMREVHLSMDDFGTGHSSLSCLHQFPFTTLKIDREFVRDCAQKQSSLEVVRAILSLARVLELKVVAEGVETQEQMNLLRTLGCDFAQGYFIAKPMPTAQAEAYMRGYDSGKYAG